MKSPKSPVGTFCEEGHPSILVQDWDGEADDPVACVESERGYYSDLTRAVCNRMRPTSSDHSLAATTFFE
eukprot:1680465-Prymnesium_polylepis.1